MKTNKNHRPIRTPRLARPRATTTTTPPLPAAPRPGCEFLDFCLYPGMKRAEPPAYLAYPTAV